MGCALVARHLFFNFQFLIFNLFKMKPYYSLSDFPDRKNAGKNFIALYPKCGTMHLYISKAKWLYHCFYAGCDFNGILTDHCKDNRPMFPYPMNMHEVPPTPGNILHRADLIRRRQPLKYPVIDPYLFVEAQSGKGDTEPQSIKAMVTCFQSWGRDNHIRVIIVAHPRSLKKIDGKNEMEDINMYTISGSANWANLAD